MNHPSSIHTHTKKKIVIINEKCYPMIEYLDRSNSISPLGMWSRGRCLPLAVSSFHMCMQANFNFFFIQMPIFVFILFWLAFFSSLFHFTFGICTS